MQTPIGTRVLAILETTETTVRYFGEGTYAGRFPAPPEARGINYGQENARIDLDDGGQVWGCECWWGPVAELRNRLSPGRAWEKVDIHQHRGAHRPAPTCPYCEQPAQLITGAEMYPRRPDLANRYFWRCAPCDAHVGCHQAGNGYGDGTQPLGRLANAALRHARSLAHAAFDPLWKGKHRPMNRYRAYEWLSEQLGLSPAETHIGEFDEATCARVITLCERRRESRVKEAS